MRYILLYYVSNNSTIFLLFKKMFKYLVSNIENCFLRITRCTVLCMNHKIQHMRIFLVLIKKFTIIYKVYIITQDTPTGDYLFHKHTTCWLWYIKLKFHCYTHPNIVVKRNI